MWARNWRRVFLGGWALVGWRGEHRSWPQPAPFNSWYHLCAFFPCVLFWTTLASFTCLWFFYYQHHIPYCMLQLDDECSFLVWMAWWTNWYWKKCITWIRILVFAFHSSDKKFLTEWEMKTGECATLLTRLPTEGGWKSVLPMQRVMIKLWLVIKPLLSGWWTRLDKILSKLAYICTGDGSTISASSVWALKFLDNAFHLFSTWLIDTYSVEYSDSTWSYASYVVFRNIYQLYVATYASAASPEGLCAEYVCIIVQMLCA